ncbi:hypothetical protein Kim5_PD00313 (plasmid) [Rhizobium sp. Kim5]|nr:hypothetical protein Kim5_PD00313 [Rhizobium sp. Kim5]
MRQYGFDACEVDALGKAEVLIVLDQASRGVIGNLLCCSCPLQHSDVTPVRQSSAASSHAVLSPRPVWHVTRRSKRSPFPRGVAAAPSE